MNVSVKMGKKESGVDPLEALREEHKKRTLTGGVVVATPAGLVPGERRVGTADLAVVYVAVLHSENRLHTGCGAYSKK